MIKGNVNVYNVVGIVQGTLLVGYSRDFLYLWKGFVTIIHIVLKPILK